MSSGESPMYSDSLADRMRFIDGFFGGKRACLSMLAELATAERGRGHGQAADALSFAMVEIVERVDLPRWQVREDS